ncbi:carbohydrate ABC transporter permease [Ruminiclostridium cellobioparum]|uniref:ABC transporter, permease protein n=1 Tax=Ruminiclostridium cellobioparum subsp. termitidis CT1112 TaxID=1195236 RepID=S0FK04_RUMCE|nr:sugar ABC transporter permease [Ruminiclostridium cellobioparum]EMS72142.1 ABC transporter, permease protein [Ruminiclostridium cellobioparum subsp. termitidis CT1112]
MDIIRKNVKYIIAGLLPALLIYFIFVLYPIVRSFIYGFYDWNGLSEPIYTGLNNFKIILTDEVFWQSFKNNIFIVLFSIFGQVPIGLILAVILSRNIKGAGFFRTAFFIPMMLSTVVVGLLWSTILNSQVGIINSILEAIGLEELTQNWLGDPKLAMLSICAVIVWQCFGYYMIIFLAAIQNIPEEILEAADIDGAGELKKLTNIILPMLWPTVMTAVVLCISGSMRSFDLVFVMTGGGPANATELMATYMYNKTFAIYQYGYGSAVSLVISVISFGLIIISRSLMSRNLSD